MTRRIKTVFRFLAFSLCVWLTVWWINNLVVMKYMYDVAEPHTKTYQDFYKMKKDTVDVLILGTSHAASGFNPQEFYNARKIRAYNLSSSAQQTWISYYWLEEALKYQKSSVVIFDCNYLFQSNNNEGANRRALDNMRWSDTKYNAVKACMEADTTGLENVLSYLLPFFRYHSRWTNLKSWDFYWNNSEGKNSLLKGFWFYMGNTAPTEMIYLKDQDPDGKTEPLDPVSEKYLDKIHQICKSKGVTLILVKTPSRAFTQEMHNRVKEWAEDNTVRFIDFNTEDIYKKCGFGEKFEDFNNWSATSAHANPYGARKMSIYMADYISDQKLVNGVEDEQWESTAGFNESLYQELALRNTTDLYTYLRLLNNKRYSVMISSKEDAGSFLPEAIVEQLHRLGLKDNPSKNPKNSYLSVIDRGTVVTEQLSKRKISYCGSILNGEVRLKMSSAGADAGNSSSILLDESEKSINKRGLNIAVYDNARCRIIDQVNFDTGVAELSCHR